MNRLWWPSGLSCQQCSHKLAAEDLGLNPAQGRETVLNLIQMLDNLIYQPNITFTSSMNRILGR